MIRKVTGVEGLGLSMIIHTFILSKLDVIEREQWISRVCS